MAVNVNTLDPWASFRTEPEDNVTVNSHVNTEPEDTDLRTLTSNITEPEGTDLRTEVERLLCNNDQLQSTLHDVADRINKYKHRSEGIIGVTLLDILTGVIITVITFVILPFIPIVAFFIGICGGAVLVAAITIVIVTLVFERVNKNKAGATGHRSISSYKDEIDNIENATLKQKIKLKEKDIPSPNERLTVGHIKSILPTLRLHRDVLIKLT